MRCRFCGSTAIHSAEEYKDFSVGKAIAGTIVFGPTGAVAGATGKKIKGYRCAKCGSFMDKPMDLTIERMVNDAIYDATFNDMYISYNRYKKDYPNIEDVDKKSELLKNNSKEEFRATETNINSAQTTRNQGSDLKRKFFYGKWQPKSPIYVKEVIIKTYNEEDRLSLNILNQSKKTIRSLYLQIRVYDDAGDEITAKRCVYQGVNIFPSEYFPSDKEFLLGTEYAYSIDLCVEKVVFSDDIVWRGDDSTITLNINLPEEIDCETFPRYKYLVGAYREVSQKQYPSYMPVKYNDFWICTCGTPVKLGDNCPFCDCSFDTLQEIMSQNRLTEIQLQTVKQRASYRAKKTVTKHEQIVNKIKQREELKNTKSYDSAIALKENGSIESLTKAIEEFHRLDNFKDSKEQAKACQELLKKQCAEEERKAKILEEETYLKKKKHKKRVTVLVSVVAACIVGFVIISTVILPEIQKSKQYKTAETLLKEGSYADAAEVYESLGNYKDAEEKTKECQYNKAMEEMNSHAYDKAKKILEQLGEYKDSVEQVDYAKQQIKIANDEETYKKALAFIKNRKYEEAYNHFKKIKGYKDVNELLNNFHTVPTVIRCHYDPWVVFKFEYNNRGMMKNASVTNNSDETISFNNEGVLMKRDDGRIQTQTFEYLGDSIISHYQNYSGVEYGYTVYDIYGNTSSAVISLDEHHNNTSSNISNIYDTEGNLIEVVRKMKNGYELDTDFDNQIFYWENAPENCEELIWRNIRLISGHGIWEFE